LESITSVKKSPHIQLAVKMGWGILDDPKTARPPGTVLLDDVKQLMLIRQTGDGTYRHLKKDGHVVLQPQPTDSVNDPLNWTFRRKVTIIFTLICTGVAVGGMMSMLGTAGRQLAERYKISYPVGRNLVSRVENETDRGLGTDSNAASAWDSGQRGSAVLGLCHFGGVGEADWHRAGCRRHVG
jgi:hypothetical protein